METTAMGAMQGTTLRKSIMKGSGMSCIQLFTRIVNGILNDGKKSAKKNAGNLRSPAFNIRLISQGIFPWIYRVI